SSTEFLAPLATITPDNRGAVITLDAYILLCMTVIVVAIKVSINIYSRTFMASTDIPLLIALIVASFQSLLTQFAADSGLGRHNSPLILNQISLIKSAALSQNTFFYAAQHLLILALSLFMISTCQLIYNITPNRTIRSTCVITLTFNAVWTIFALLATTLQCQPPRWKFSPSRCIGKGAITYSIMAINIAIYLAFLIISIAMLRGVQMALRTRLQVLAAFSGRLLQDILWEMARMVYLSDYLQSTDPTWPFVNVDLCNQVIMYLSIITTCMPSVYRVLSHLNYGLNGVHLSEECELSSMPNSSG
ncbi:uncharacterized protein BO97DRAFT_322907, partial [Aspergillus homomorphus CBS 101889]